MFSTNIHEKFALPLSQSLFTVLVISIVFHVICAVVSISGNLLVLLVYRKRVLRRRARTPDYLRLNLAISDFAVGLLLIPLFIVSDVFILCQQVLFLRAVLEFSIMPFLGSVSIWTVFGMSIDRLVSVKWPYDYKTIMNPSRIYKWLFFTWIWASSWIWVPFLPDVVGKYIIMIRSLVGFGITIAILYCWINIYLELRKLTKVYTGKDTSKNRSTWHINAKRKTIKMFFFVVISLYVCYVPLWVLGIANGFNFFKSPHYEIFAIFLVLANSSVNPIIYSFTSTIFRDELFGRKSTT